MIDLFTIKLGLITVNVGPIYLNSLGNSLERRSSYSVGYIKLSLTLCYVVFHLYVSITSWGMTIQHYKQIDVLSVRVLIREHCVIISSHRQSYRGYIVFFSVCFLFQCSSDFNFQRIFL